MNAGIYVRTSTVRQGEEGTSLKTQEEQARLKAAELGYEVYPEHVWIDMESGADLNRTQVNLMLEAVRHREVYMIIVYDHDRLSRDPLDLLNVQRIFIDAGVSLEFVRGPSDTSPEGQLMTYFMGYAAQKERLQFMERAMRGKEQAARDGRMPSTGGVGLYGYDYNPALRQRTINETETEVVPNDVPTGHGRGQHVPDRLHDEREKDSQQNREVVESKRGETDPAEPGLHRDPSTMANSATGG